MSTFAEPAAGAATTSTDFMRQAYELNGEPLRFLEGGQRWFNRLLEHEYSPQPGARALVLGATPWLSAAIRETTAHTAIVDVSAAMLAMCEDMLRPGHEARASCSAGERGPVPELEFLQADWLALPASVKGLGVVAGDNSFSFLRYADEWDEMLDILASRMADSSILVMRFLSIPANHRRLCPAEIVRNALAQPAPVNPTAVRVALLFAHWDASTYTIRPEEALATFEAHRRDFDPIMFAGRGDTGNDLLSVEKYRGTGATYFAPPLAEALARIERCFHVRAVYFGPYEMTHYFPLVVASKEIATSRAWR